MDPTPELIDALHLDKLRVAKATPRRFKVLEGPRLFDRSCAFMKAGLRLKEPHATEERLNELLVMRVERLRQIERAKERRDEE